MLIIGGNLLVDPQQVDALADGLQALGASALEAGALFFAAAIEKRAAGCVLVLERWPDKGALSGFLAGDDAQRFFRIWGPHLRNELLKFDVSNQRPSQAE